MIPANILRASDVPEVLDRVRQGLRPTPAEALLLADCDELERLLAAAADMRDQGYGDVVSYSR